MQLFSSPSARRRTVVVLVAVAAAFVGLAVGVREYAPFLTDAKALRAWVNQFGALAPLAFILVQTLQVVLAPIPGQTLALVGGYLFGAVAGTVYSLVGVVLGSAIAFCLSKRYGRPFVEQVLEEDVIERFDGFVARVGLPGLFLFVAVPGLPDDVVCFLAGLTTWRLRTFIVVVAVGRLPAYVLTVVAGDSIADGEIALALVLLGVLAVLSVIAYYKQERILAIVEGLSP